MTTFSARPANRTLGSRLSAAMPGGVLGTFVTPPDFVVARGSGAYLYDSEGREYLDCALGSGPLILGHAYPSVVEAVTRQINQGTHYYAATLEALKLAEMLIDAAPCAELVKFTTSGAEATFYALRLARAFTGRDVIVRFAGSYHGHHDYAISGASAGVPASVADLVCTATFNDVDSVADAFARQPDAIAAVIVEPIQRAIAPRPDFLRDLAELCVRRGALLIFDEVVTGFRIERGGAQAFYGVTPDLAAYGKVIGGGLPLGAVAGRRDVMSLANPRAQSDRYVYFSGTLNGNPLSATAGLATLRVLDETNGYQQLSERGSHLRSRLTSVAASSPLPFQVTGDGPMAGLVFADGDPFAAATHARNDKRIMKLVEQELLKQGVLTNLNAKIYLSLVHTDADIERLCTALDAALVATFQRR